MKSSKVYFVLMFSLVAVVFALFEYNVLPRDLIANTPETNYAIDIASAATSVGGCFLLLYWFRIPPIRIRLQRLGDDNEAFYHRHWNIRLTLWCVFILLNIALYYLASYANNPKYCIIILCIAGIFCWPAKQNSKTVNSKS